MPFLLLRVLSSYYVGTMRHSAYLTHHDNNPLMYIHYLQFTNVSTQVFKVKQLAENYTTEPGFQPIVQSVDIPLSIFFSDFLGKELNGCMSIPEALNSGLESRFTSCKHDWYCCNMQIPGQRS